MFIKQSQIVGAHQLIPGKVKFYKREENFGFIDVEDKGDVFVHRQWLMKPECLRKGNIFGVKFVELDEPLHPEQLVFLELRENKERGCFEARNVVDMLELQMCMKSVGEDAARYDLWVLSLPVFRAFLIRDQMSWKANNKTKKYDPIKTGEEREQIFYGNDTNELERIISGQYLLNNMRIHIEKKDEDRWIPVSKVAA